MVVIFSSTIAVDTNNGSCIQNILDLFDNPSNELKSRMYCPRCRALPSTYLYNGNDNYHRYVRFVCNICKSSWNLCRSCPCNRQYDFLHISLQRSSYGGVNELRTQMESHERMYHQNTSESLEEFDLHTNEMIVNEDEPNHQSRTNISS